MQNLIFASIKFIIKINKIMGLKLISEHLNGLKVFEPAVFGDERGWFLESFRSDEFDKLGLNVTFVQDNHSLSKKGTIRGMHFQWDLPQGKLIRVTRGCAYVVEVDIRKNSNSLGKWFGIDLSEDNKKVLWVPPGFANGFLSKSEIVEMQYKCTNYWNKNGESNIRWNDPELNINWNENEPYISDKDKTAQTLSEWLQKPESENFKI